MVIPAWADQLRYAIAARFGPRGIAECARNVHLPRNTIENWLKGKSRPQFEKLKQLCDALDLKVDDLLSPGPAKIGEELTPYVPGPLVKVPVFDIQAGSGIEYDDAGFPTGHSDRYAFVESPDDPNAFALDVHGDSMDDGSHRAIPEGSRVIVSPRRPACPGDLVIARLHSGPTLKELVNCNLPQAVQLHPWNKEYHDIVVNRTDILALWKVIITIRRYL